MRKSFRQLFWIGALLWSAAAIADQTGTLESLDPAAATLTISRGPAFTTFRYRPNLEITFNGLKAPLSALLPGMSVKVATSEPGVAAKIAATGSPVRRDSPSAQPALKSWSGSGREMRILITIPGADAIMVRSNQLWLQHVSAMKHGFPTRITINATPWDPSWDERTSGKYLFRPPLAGFANGEILVTKVSGRSEMKVEQPSQENDRTLRIDLTDAPVGAGEVELQLSW